MAMDSPSCPPFSFQLPDDLTLEILARVPARDHASLRAVSTTWRTTIDSPEFHSRRHELGFVDLCLLAFSVESAPVGGLQKGDKGSRAGEHSFGCGLDNRYGIRNGRMSNVACHVLDLGGISTGVASRVGSRFEAGSEAGLDTGDALAKDFKCTLEDTRLEEDTYGEDDELQISRQSSSIRCRVFDLRARSWFELPLPYEMAVTHFLGSVAVFEGTLVVVGGESQAGRSTSSGWRYDLREREWQPMPSMLTPRQRPIAVGLDECLYVLGVSSRERFHLLEGEWEVVDGVDWPFLRGHLNAPGVILDSSLYVHKRYLEIAVTLPGQAEKWSRLELLPRDETCFGESMTHRNLRHDKWLKILSEAASEVVQVNGYLYAVKCEHFYCDMEVYLKEESRWAHVISTGEIGLVVAALKTKTPQLCVVGSSVFLLGATNAVIRVCLHSEPNGIHSAEWSVLHPGLAFSEPWAFIGIS